MNALARNRGLLAAYANAAGARQVLAALQTSFEDFRDRHDSRLDRLEADLDQANATIAAMRLGGGGGDPANTPASRRQAFNALGRFGRSGSPEDLVNGLTAPQASMSRDSNPDGGYVVGEEISNEILRIQRNDSAMRRIARVVGTSSANFKQPFSLGGAASGWVGERQGRTETDGPDLALIDIPAGEVYANPAITQGLLDDAAYDLGQFIATEIGDAFTDQEGAAFLTGDGINKPRGFLTYPIVGTADSSRPFGELQFVASGVAAALSDNDHNGGDALIELVLTLKAKYRQNATWLMNSMTLAAIAKLKHTDKGYLFTPNLVEGTPGRLLGYPVAIDEGMPSIGASEHPIAFGDFSRGYLITDRTGVRILRDPYTNKPYVMFYATKRVGGALLDSNAIKLLKIAAS